MLAADVKVTLNWNLHVTISQYTQLFKYLNLSMTFKSAIFICQFLAILLMETEKKYVLTNYTISCMIMDNMLIYHQLFL